MKRIYTFLFCILLSTTYTLGQEAIIPRPSPLAMVTMSYHDTYIKVTYSQPHKKNREVFGELVPYGEVWRTGANEATEITLTGKIKIGNKMLSAGTYSLFSIPDADEWTIIFNKNLGQWGSYNYTEKADVLRIKAKSEILEKEVYEPFTIKFNQKNKIAEMVMLWDQTKVVIPIEILED